MAEGLLAAHLAGIIHRDIKPSNVFLAARPGARLSAKLLDFGVAKLLGAPEITRTGAVVGTPAYMAPEQARGEEDIDARADLYGLGAVLYKMVSGRAPFEARDATASLTTLLAGPPRPIAGLVPDLPIDLIRVIEDTMARDPKDRPEGAREVLARLRRIAETLADDLGDDAHRPERPVGATAASAEATTVMPAGVVRDAAERRSALVRARPRAARDVLLAALTAGGGAAILAAAALRPTTPATVALFAACFVATLAARAPNAPPLGPPCTAHRASRRALEERTRRARPLRSAQLRRRRAVVAHRRRPAPRAHALRRRPRNFARDGQRLSVSRNSPRPCRETHEAPPPRLTRYATATTTCESAEPRPRDTPHHTGPGSASPRCRRDVR
jgi:serine/threonine-protein kinase